MGLFGNKPKFTEVKAPVAGKLRTLKSINDGVFSEEMMGPGVVISPTDGKVYAPIDGIMATVFPTGHAYGIQNKLGASILVHIGLDTVNLKGEGFSAKVTQGQKVKAGDLLCEFDLALINKKAPSSDVIILATPETKGTVQNIKTSGNITIDQNIFVIK